jgi:hypothetical protein
VRESRAIQRRTGALEATFGDSDWSSRRPVDNAPELPSLRSAWRSRWPVTRDVYYERRRQEYMDETPPWDPTQPVQEPVSGNGARDIQMLRDTMRRFGDRPSRFGDAEDPELIAFLGSVWGGPQLPRSDGPLPDAPRPNNGSDDEADTEHPSPWGVAPDPPTRRPRDSNDLAHPWGQAPDPPTRPSRDMNEHAWRNSVLLARNPSLAGFYHPSERPTAAVGIMSASALFDADLIF